MSNSSESIDDASRRADDTNDVLKAQFSGYTTDRLLEIQTATNLALEMLSKLPAGHSLLHGGASIEKNNDLLKIIGEIILSRN